MKRKLLFILLFTYLLLIMTGCNSDNVKTNATLEELTIVNNEIIEYFSKNDFEYKNFTFNYIDEENNVVIVGLLDNSEKKQKEFKNKVIDSDLIKFVQGTENINQSLYK